MVWTRGTSAVTIASSSRGVYAGYARLSLNNSTKGQFDLIINPTQRDDANIYSCIVGFEPAVPADLVLLGTFRCRYIAQF